MFGVVGRRVLTQQNLLKRIEINDKMHKGDPKKKLEQAAHGYPVWDRKVYISQPTRNASQQGHNRSLHWEVRYVNANAKTPNTLMGWPATTDPHAGIIMSFASKENALQYVHEKGLDYFLDESNPLPNHFDYQSYGDNFKYRPPPSEEEEEE